MSYLKRITFVLIGNMVLSGCDNNDSTNVDNQALRGLATTAGLDGDAIEGKTIPAITDPLAQLGMKLFFFQRVRG
jgi:hypothetical protein